MKIAHPAYYQIVEHTIHNNRDAWLFLIGGKVVYNPSFRPLNREKFSKKEERSIIFELFRINGGKKGYYLVNRRDCKYYYCGESPKDVRAKFLSLGIGRKDPN